MVTSVSSPAHRVLRETDNTAHLERSLPPPSEHWVGGGVMLPPRLHLARKKQDVTDSVQESCPDSEIFLRLSTVSASVELGADSKLSTVHRERCGAR